MAKERKHSTVSQAIDVATKMEARATILTHFSQRYPKAIDIGGGGGRSGDGTNVDDCTAEMPVCTAFDGIDIDFGMLPHLRLLNDRVKRELDRLEAVRTHTT